MKMPDGCESAGFEGGKDEEEETEGGIETPDQEGGIDAQVREDLDALRQTVDTHPVWLERVGKAVAASRWKVMLDLDRMPGSD